MQWRDLSKYKYLEQDEKSKPDDISYKIAHQSFFTFFMRESNSAFCRFLTT